MKHGTLVTPASPLDGEVIVGITVTPFDESPDSDWNVVWFSTQRGVFVALEQHDDLRPAELGDRDRMDDPRLDHADVAEVLGHVDWMDVRS